jgi:hypothetical protein
LKSNRSIHENECFDLASNQKRRRGRGETGESREGTAAAECTLKTEQYVIESEVRQQRGLSQEIAKEQKF